MLNPNPFMGVRSMQQRLVYRYERLPAADAKAAFPFVMLGITRSSDGVGIPVYETRIAIASDRTIARSTMLLDLTPWNT